MLDHNQSVQGRELTFVLDHNQAVQGNRRELTLEERMFILAHEIACYGSALDEETIKYYTRPASKKNKDRLGKIINSLKN